MRNYILFAVVFLLGVLSCEEDDVCIDSTEAKLIVGFNNRVVSDSIYSIQNIQAVNLSSNDTLSGVYSNGKLTLPLSEDVTSANYNLRLQFVSQTGDSTDIKQDVVDNLSVSYTAKYSYISKACGFSVFLDDVEYNTQSTEIESSKNFIQTTDNDAHLILSYN